MIEKAPLVKAEPIKRDNTEDVKGLEKKISQYQQFIDSNKTELKLRKEILEFQTAHPKTLKPNFEFEETEGWDKLVIRQWELQAFNETIKINSAIEITVMKKLELEQELMKLKKEVKQ